VFAKAAHVTKLDLVNNRLIPNPIEPRVAIGSYSRGTDDYTLYVSNQNPHVERLLMTAFVLGLPEHKVRVIAPDVGGGFGSKIFLYAEDVCLTWAAKQLNRNIKWTAERSECFLSDAHGRDHVSHAEMAMDKDGKFLAMRVHTDANLGAYLSTFSTAVPTILYATLLAGQYTTPQIYVEVDAWFTNTAPVDAYRGAGRPEATYLLERLVSRCAWEMNLGQDEIRKRNFITAFPYQTPVALQYDTGDFHACMDKAKILAEVEGFAQRKAATEAKGKLRGIGYSSYIEACGIAPSNIAGALGARAGLFECGEIRVHPTGSVTVFTGSHSHGQGHETTFAQVVAARLGIPVDNVDVVHGDTGRVPFGMGTYGSRSISVGGAAIMKALDKIETKAKKIAAHLMEASDADIEFANGEFTVKGTDKKIPFGQVALTAYVPHNYPLDKLEPGLNETAFYDPTNFTFPGGTYICEVEVDKQTGEVRVDRFTAVDDFGTIINPMIVEGQVHGGLVQGIGQALLENCVYDNETGQLLTGSFMDYAMPRADDCPVQAGHRVHAVHAQPAGHQGLRRGGRHRLAAGRDQRGARRTGAARREGLRHACLGQPCLGSDAGCRPSLKTRKEPHHVCLHTRTALHRGRCGQAGQRRRQAAGRRPDAPCLHEAQALRARAAGGPWRRQGTHRHQERRQHHHHRRHVAPPRCSEQHRRESRVPRAGRFGRAHRRPAGARDGHHRRLGGQQRPGRVLPQRGARRRRDHRHLEARDRGG
jgi:carbon-monoxide dehydrogenase large subunit